MRILYPIEEYYYTKEEILDFTPNSDELITRRILVKHKKTDLYKFNYVGMIVDRAENVTSLLMVLPKYLEDITLSEEEKQEYANLLIKVFRKYAKESIENDNSDDLDYLGENTHFNFLAVLDYLIRDYLQYGLYSNNIETHEYNGNGQIDWVKTLNDEYAVPSGKQVLYTDFHTITEENDENNHIRQIHHTIIFESFKFLEEFSFLDFFEFPSLYITEAKHLIEDSNYKIQAVNIEINNVFSDRKINLLKAMKYYMERESALSTNDVVFFGTTSFHTIWEKAVSSAFSDQYDDYKGFIPVPSWIHTSTCTVTSSETLLPDTIRKMENDIYVIDAKYYHYPFADDGSLLPGHPGIGDVSKQYLYVSALKGVLSSYEFHNSFLMPSSAVDIENIGEIEFDLFPDLPNIQIVLFPGKRIFEMYVSGEELKDEEIVLYFSS